jgi:hypothetical protein
MTTYIVYCQSTAVYENGERDHEYYEYKRFDSESEASACAEGLNLNPYRDIDEYFFVRAES